MKPWKLAASSSCAAASSCGCGAEASAFCTALKSRASSNGLTRKSKAPARIACTARLIEPFAVMTITREFRRLAPHRLQELQAVAVGKLQVEQHQMRLVALAVRPRLGQAEGADHPVTGPREHGLVERRQRRRIFHEQDAIGHPELPHRRPRRSRAKATAVVDLGDAAAHARHDLLRRVGMGRGVEQPGTGLEPHRPERPRNRDQDVRRTADRRALKGIERSGEFPLRRQQVGDDLVEQLVHRVRPDGRAERIEDPEIDHRPGRAASGADTGAAGIAGALRRSKGATCAASPRPSASTLVIGFEIRPFAPAAAMRSRCSRIA